MGCPVRTDARAYVIAIAEGRSFDAHKIARAPNPFASICGRVCGAPCEVECRRGSIDDAVTIRALKRFATEQHGVEAAFPGGMFVQRLTEILFPWIEREEPRETGFPQRKKVRPA